MQAIRGRDWVKLARELRLSPAEVIDRIDAMAERISMGAGTVADSLRKEGINHPVVDTLVGRLLFHVNERLSKWHSADHP